MRRNSCDARIVGGSTSRLPRNVRPNPSSRALFTLSLVERARITLIEWFPLHSVCACYPAVAAATIAASYVLIITLLNRFLIYISTRAIAHPASAHIQRRVVACDVRALRLFSLSPSPLSVSVCLSLCLSLFLSLSFSFSTCTLRASARRHEGPADTSSWSISDTSTKVVASRFQIRVKLVRVYTFASTLLPH